MWMLWVWAQLKCDYRINYCIFRPEIFFIHPPYKGIFCSCWSDLWKMKRSGRRKDFQVLHSPTLMCRCWANGWFGCGKGTVPIEGTTFCTEIANLLGPHWVVFLCITCAKDPITPWCMPSSSFLSFLQPSFGSFNSLCLCCGSKPGLFLQITLWLLFQWDMVDMSMRSNISFIISNDQEKEALCSISSMCSLRFTGWHKLYLSNYILKSKGQSTVCRWLRIEWRFSTGADHGLHGVFAR